METRPPDHGTPNDQDLWTQLQKKESDLLLAAELGKALLEKNEELAKQQEKIIEEYSKKLECLEQEKHILRRKLSEAESERDLRVQELESDYNDLKSKLMSQESSVRHNEREKNVLVDELASQNARLTQQLQAANQLEVQLNNKLQELKSQYNIQHQTLQNHINGLESLKDELNIITKAKNELEKRLQTTVIEKETIFSSLEEALDRIHTLERHAREQESKLKSTTQHLDRVQVENNALYEKLGSIQNSPRHSSLMNEMECDEDQGIGDSNKSLNTIDAIAKEARTVYNQLKMLHFTLKGNHDGDSGLHSDLFLGSADQSSTNQYDSTEELHQGMLSALTDDIINLIMSMDVVHFKTMLDKSRATNQDQEEELRRRQTNISDLECKLSVMEVELRSALEDRNRAQADASESSLAQDDVVSQARSDRDSAIQRRTKAEIELAKTRVELMQANSELLEAINQKVELSQQLEQWQVDMHELLEEQMKRQLEDSQRKSKSVAVPAAPPKPAYSHLLMRLFQR
ncbi:bicaudal D-related protein homolog isoform X2 [Contarinia nasturtii]|nr:bicaudal D-related protein homolog isoform X2 [Contarinia nasturtii]